MEISQNKSGSFLVLSLCGRLDAGWCDPVESALMAAIRGGEHRIHLDMEKVDYISSAGISVLLACFKQLATIQGTFGVIDPSAGVCKVLELSGLKMLIAQREVPVAADHPPLASIGVLSASANANYEVFTLPTKVPLNLSTIGGENWICESGPASQIRFGELQFALGVGALGTEESDCAKRFGEFLAIAGIAAVQPTDGSSRPDFILQEASLVPEGYLLAGFSGSGEFPLLARFEASRNSVPVSLSELATQALELSGSAQAVVVGITETAGLVGATLQQGPPVNSAADPLAFPGIRDWVSFTSERAYRDSTTLFLGVVAREPAPLLRPHGEGLYAHFHAVSFPYRPLQKGSIELSASVRALFDVPNLQSVLHLLADPREFNGVGESEFFRGALWIAPVANPEIPMP